MSTPEEFICPISLEIMKDPVICEDGNSYERTHIIEWLKHSKTSPLTREPLVSDRIMPNESLKNAINVWLKKQKNKKKSDIPKKIIVKEIQQPYNYTDHIITIQNEPLLNNNNSLNRNISEIIISYKKFIAIICCMSLGLLFVILLYLYIVSS
jgi:hypothetical protein